MLPQAIEAFTDYSFHSWDKQLGCARELTLKYPSCPHSSINLLVLLYFDRYTAFEGFCHDADQLATGQCWWNAQASPAAVDSPKALDEINDLLDKFKDPNSHYHIAPGTNGPAHEGDHSASRSPLSPVIPASNTTAADQGVRSTIPVQSGENGAATFLANGDTAKASKREQAREAGMKYFRENGFDSVGILEWPVAWGDCDMFQWVISGAHTLSLFYAISVIWLRPESGTGTPTMSNLWDGSSRLEYAMGKLWSPCSPKEWWTTCWYVVPVLTNADAEPAQSTARQGQWHHLEGHYHQIPSTSDLSRYREHIPPPDLLWMSWMDVAAHRFSTPFHKPGAGLLRSRSGVLVHQACKTRSSRRLVSLHVPHLAVGIYRWPGNSTIVMYDYDHLRKGVMPDTFRDVLQQREKSNEAVWNNQHLKELNGYLWCSDASISTVLREHSTSTWGTWKWKQGINSRTGFTTDVRAPPTTYKSSCSNLNRR